MFCFKILLILVNLYLFGLVTADLIDLGFLLVGLVGLVGLAGILYFIIIARWFTLILLFIS